MFKGAKNKLESHRQRIGAIQQGRSLFGTFRMAWEEIRRKEIWLVATQINGWFIMENPIKMGWFGGNPIFGNTLFWIFTQYLGKWSNLTCIFFRWVAKNHQLEILESYWRKSTAWKQPWGTFLLLNSPRRSHPLYDRNEIEGRFKLSSRYVWLLRAYIYIWMICV